MSMSMLVLEPSATMPVFSISSPSPPFTVWKACDSIRVIPVKLPVKTTLVIAPPVMLAAAMLTVPDPLGARTRSPSVSSVPMVLPSRLMFPDRTTPVPFASSIRFPLAFNVVIVLPSIWTLSTEAEPVPTLSAVATPAALYTTFSEAVGPPSTCRIWSKVSLIWVPVKLMGIGISQKKESGPVGGLTCYSRT